MKDKVISDRQASLFTVRSEHLVIAVTVSNHLLDLGLACCTLHKRQQFPSNKILSPIFITSFIFDLQCLFLTWLSD